MATRQKLAWWRRRGIHGALPLERLRAIDAELFETVARLRLPMLDGVLPRLSRLANRSVLWMVISAGLIATGNSRARRAATRGLLSVGATSAIVNLPVKLLFRRVRPPIDSVPIVRRLTRLPTSSSFPSGHSASAFAFAVGASQELPPAGVALYPLAGLVAFSRVYVGVHFPVDVAVGSVLGAALALSTRRFWPIRPEVAARAKAAPLPDRDAMGQDVTIVVNNESGSVLARKRIAQIEKALPGVRIVEINDGARLEEELEDAARRSSAIGICGGDGSINAAAQVALEKDKPLLVLPGGTLNHLAQAIGVKSIGDAMEAVAKRHAIGIDVAAIDERVFLNTASLGTYVELVDARERLEDKIGKWPATLVALVRVLRSAPIPIELDGRRLRVWMAFFGNCRYHPSGFTPSWRERLDDGLIDFRYIDASTRWARLRLMLAISTGRLGRSRVYEQATVKRVHVRSVDGAPRLALDGETFRGSEEFVVEKLPAQLVVYAPRRD